MKSIVVRVDYFNPNVMDVQLKLAGVMVLSAVMEAKKPMPRTSRGTQISMRISTTLYLY